MKCRDCKFLTVKERTDDYSIVRCTLGLWDKGTIQQWHSFGECQLNRGPVRRFGESCSRGEAK
jgi:hypothetical protein